MARSSIRDKILTTITGAVVMAVLGAVGLYFSSFAGKAQVDGNTKKIASVEKKVENFKREVTVKIAEQNIQIKKTQDMICGLAVTLVDDREKAARICARGQ